jgi:hypothetical protein
LIMSGIGQTQTGNTFTDTPGIATVASPSGAGVAEGARSNSGLGLAASLQDLNPNLRALASTVVAEDQAVQSAAAKKAALLTGGKDLASAVRDGTLTPTQNPFFIQDYNREATAVSSQADLDQLSVDASQWAEKNDPVAFRQKYSQAVQQIAGKYGNDRDAQEGFQSTAAPAMQQAFSANAAYNSQRIVQERQENLSALTAREIQTAVATNGGRPTGAQLDAAITPLKQQWLSTGGDLAAWNKVAIQGLTAAAFNIGQADHKRAGLLLDQARNMSNGLNGDQSGSLYDTLGTAEQLTTAKYRIDQEYRDGMRLDIQARQERVYEQGLQAQGALFQQFGPRLFTGDVTPDEMTAAASKLGGQFPAAAVSEAFKGAAQTTNSIRELNANRSSFYEQSSGGSTHIASLFQEASTRGATPELQSDVGQLLLNGQISLDTQQKIMEKANGTSTKIGLTSGAMGAFKADVVAKAMDQWSATRTAVVMGVTSRVKRAYSLGHALTPGQQQEAQDAAISAASTHLQLKPGDFGGAVSAGDQAADAWGKNLAK